MHHHNSREWHNVLETKDLDVVRWYACVISYVVAPYVVWRVETGGRATRQRDVRASYCGPWPCLTVQGKERPTSTRHATLMLMMLQWFNMIPQGLPVVATVVRLRLTRPPTLGGAVPVASLLGTYEDTCVCAPAMQSAG